MTQFMVMAALGLIMAQQARADYSCIDFQNNQTLVIHHQTQPGVINAEGPVEVTLNGNEAFKGAYTKGGGYVLNDAQGLAVALQISTSPMHAGRCGRCGTVGEVIGSTTFAKLTVPGVAAPEYFTCNEP